jgi:hypothetical protein
MFQAALFLTKELIAKEWQQWPHAHGIHCSTMFPTTLKQLA